MFKRMETAEEIYEGGSPSKKITAEADHAIFDKKKKGGASASPSKPKQGRAGKYKKNYTGLPRDDPTGAKNKCLLHGPGQYLEECNVLK